MEAAMKLPSLLQEKFEEAGEYKVLGFVRGPRSRVKVLLILHQHYVSWPNSVILSFRRMDL